MNTTSNEICEATEAETKGKFLMFMTGSFCKPVKPINWKMTNCLEISSENYKIPKPQIKIVNEDFYVYCFGYNISLFKYTRNCPNAILKLSRDMSFSIGDSDYKVENYLITNTKKVDGWSNQINWRIMFDPVKFLTLNSTTIKMLERVLDSKPPTVKTEKPWFEKLKDELTNLLIGIIACCIILLLIFKLLSMLCYMIKRPIVSVALVPENVNQRPYLPNTMAISRLY